MKSQKAFQMALKLLSIMFFIAACSMPRPTFQSDEQIKTNFQSHKAELLMLMQKCKSEKKSQGGKRYVRDAFSICKVNQAQLKKLSLEEIAVEFIWTKTFSKEFKGSRILFITNQYVDDPADTFVEEKGYMFSATPITKDLIREGSLDQLLGKDLFERKGRKEIWKYKQIEPNWYIYYRQHFYPYLG